MVRSCLLYTSQVGALYADKTLSRYNDPALFTFSGGSGNAYVVDGCMGSWIIESTGSNTEDIYEFLDRENNSKKVKEKLQQLMKNGEAGTISLEFKGDVYKRQGRILPGNLIIGNQPRLLIADTSDFCMLDG